MLGRLLKKAEVAFTQDPYVIQALEDQKKADYKGCPQGLMQCRAFCDCTSTHSASAAWVTARAEKLRRIGQCKHEHTQQFRPSMFSEFVTGVQCTSCQAVKKEGETTWEWEN